MESKDKYTSSDSKIMFPLHQVVWARLFERKEISVKLSDGSNFTLLGEDSELFLKKWRGNE